jgi:hypothetical protein
MLRLLRLRPLLLDFTGMSTSQLPPADWPYDWLRADARLDPAVIEKQGQFFLNRALNLRSLVAFVGTGVSNAYGRVSWGELAGVQIGAIVQASEGKSAAGQEDVVELVERVRALRKDVEAGTDGAKIQLAMHLCEQIWALMEADERKRLATSFFLPQGMSDRGNLEGHELFRAAIRAETYDEAAFVWRLLCGQIDRKPASQAVNSARFFADRRNAPLTRFPPERRPRAYLSCFDEKAVDGLKAALGALRRQTEVAPGSLAYDLALHAPFASTATLDHMLGPILDLARRTRGRDTPCRLILPVRYYVVGFVLDLLRWGETAACGKPSYKEADDWLNAAAARATPSAAARSTIIAPEDDPLHRLRYGLEIRRFVTTNYDLEIERLFDDKGFRRSRATIGAPLEENEIERASALGTRARDILLRTDTAIDLLDFAVHESGYGAQLVHLHGRATDGDDVVVTERDYQLLYLKEGKDRATLSEGLDVLFGGNPIMFVGIGLSEGDILRPLREFLQSSLRRNRSIFALRAGDTKKAAQDAFTMEQFAQHGVHILHYGRLSKRGAAAGSKNADEIYWMMAFRDIYDKLNGICHDIADALAPDKLDELKSVPVLAEHGAARMKSIGVKLRLNELFKIGGPHPVTYEQLARDCGLIKPALRSGVHNAFVFPSDDGLVDIRFEAASLYLIGQLLERTIDFLAKPVDPASQAASIGRLRSRLDQARNLVEDVLGPAVMRTWNAIHTAALVARLEGLENDWKIWWRRWQRQPQDRTEELRFDFPMVQLRNLTQIESDKSTWGRHFVHEAIPPAPSGSVEFLLRSLPAAPDPGKTGRRIFIIAARRGAGKGKLFSELRHFGDWILCGGYDPNRPHTPAERYRGRFFANLSFSSEIASVWDAMTAFLQNPEGAHEAGANWARSREDGTLRGVSRMDRLRTLFHELERRPETADRLLIAINAFDLLLESDGYPKQSEIRGICDLFFGKRTKTVPIDILLVAREDKIPLYFRQDPDPLIDDRRTKCPLTCDHVEILYRDQEQEHRLIPEIESRLRRVGIRSQLCDYAAPTPRPVYLHILRPLRPPFRPTQAERARRPPEGEPFSDKETFDLLLRAADDLKLTNYEGRALLNRVVHNRYIYTLCWHVFRHIIRLQRQNAWTDPQARMLARDTLSDITLRATTPSEALEDRILDRILEFWADAPRFENDEHIPLPLDPEFHLRIIRHMAVIGIPIEPTVLLLCPRVAEKVKEALQSVDEGARSRQASIMIRETLKVLAERGLAFVVSSRKPDGQLLARYALHRSLQLHVYKQLGSQTLEPLEANYFSASLYASQTRELPTLSAEAYSFVNDVIYALSGYPDRKSMIRSPPSRYYKGLRAAIGVARSLYSIGVVGRFADVAGLPVRRPPDIGYFEQHRLLIRFLLHRATELPPTRKVWTPSYPRAWEPFYRDEIMWLYNECGVFSLAQGHVQDAKALFKMALDCAGDIEGVSGGPMRRRILLNAGATAIDRGRLAEAERCFDEVLLARQSEDQTIIQIAEGYLALCHHLRGRIEIAEPMYRKVIEKLEGMSRVRPVSVFARYLGDLYRRHRSPDDALLQYARAVRAARSGGYEDAAMWAQLSEARVMLLKNDRDEALARILTVERYAEQMDMPSLTCEVLIVRAENLLAQGEILFASEIATRALRLATLHGLRLRKITVMDLLAQILLARGQITDAERLRKQNIRYARAAGYALLAARAERPEPR